MPFGWEGEKVRLVPLEKERHFENCVRWLNDPEVTQWTLIGDFPLTRLAEEQFFDRVTGTTDTDVVFAIETLGDEEQHIGVTGVHQISYRHGSGLTGTFIGRRQLHGRGFGSDAIAIRSRYVFDVLGLRLLLSEVLADNVASLKAVRRNGYREIGRIPKRYWKRGAFRDSVLLTLTREDWRQRATP